MPLSAALNDPKLALNGTPVLAKLFNFQNYFPQFISLLETHV